MLQLPCTVNFGSVAQAGSPKPCKAESVCTSFGAQTTRSCSSLGRVVLHMGREQGHGWRILPQSPACTHPKSPGGLGCQGEGATTDHRKGPSCLPHGAHRCPWVFAVGYVSRFVCAVPTTAVSPRRHVQEWAA